MLVIVFLLLVSCANPRNTNDSDCNDDTSSELSTDNTKQDSDYSSYDDWYTTNTDNEASSDKNDDITDLNSDDEQKNDQNEDDKTSIDSNHTFTTDQRYYKEIGSGYSTTTALGEKINKNGHVFDNGAFEIKQESQYKVISSFSELSEFSLINNEDLENAVFDENYIVAILHYSKRPSEDNKISAGLYNADFNNNGKSEITVDFFYTSLIGSEDKMDVYELHFIVVPKTEITNTNQGHSITVNMNIVDQYEMVAYAVEAQSEDVEAYYIDSEEARKEVDALSLNNINISLYPCIAIVLNEPIKNDYIVNGFKYENGEVYITIEIYEKSEMDYLHEISANLLVVSLTPHREGLEINVLDNISRDCRVNVIFKKVTTIN